MAKLLLTGATGLIGASLLKQLVPNHTVHAISRSAKLPLATSTIGVDLSTPWSIDQLPTDVQTVVHLAQSEHFRDFPARAKDIFAVNTESTVRLMDYALNIGARQFVLASSGGVYGGGSEPFTEDAPVRSDGPLGFYLRTRICSELLADCYSNQLNVICLRFFFVYGPGQQSHMLIPRLVDSVRCGRPITLRGPEGLRLNPVYVEDAARAVANAISLKQSDKINIAGPEVVSLRGMASAIGRMVGRAPVFEVQEGVAAQDLVGDIGRMRRLLWQPQVAFADGISATFGADA